MRPQERKKDTGEWHCNRQQKSSVYKDAVRCRI